MRKFILSWGLIVCSVPWLFAQHPELQNDSSMYTATLFGRLTKLEKKIDWFNVFLNMQGSFNIHFNDRPDKNTFRMDQLRLEMKGHITDRIYYRYRQRLNRSNSSLSMDNLPSSIDYAAVGFHVSERFSFFAGKQSTVFGGYEFDLNPIDVYEYCDLIEHMSNFLTGVNFSYQLNPEHELHFQIVDSRNGSFEEMYGQVPVGVEQAKTPLGYTLNWNGAFWDNLLKTRWSASVFHEAKKENWYYYALGTQVNLSKFNGFFDFLYSNEDLDRTGIVTAITATDGYDTRLRNTRYMSMILHLNYRIVPKINFFFKGSYETASVLKNNPDVEKGKYCTSWGYIGGVELYPMEENLHFFVTYIGRAFNYTDRAKVFGVGNSCPQRLKLGLIYQLPLF